MSEPRIKGQLLKGTTQLLVLAVLKDGELYGYEIAQQLKARTGGVFALNEGALYPALHALESSGALEAPWRDSEKGPKRRYYRITPVGHGLLATQQQEWATFNTAKDCPSASRARSLTGSTRPGDGQATPRSTGTSARRPCRPSLRPW